MAQSRERSPEAVLDALRHGRFYASTGIEITRIETEDNRIRIETRHPCRISVFSDYGYRRAMADGTMLEFAVPQARAYTYLRIECAGHYGRAAWTQPFFIE